MRRKSRFVLVLCVCMAYLSCVNVLADVKPNAYVLAENCESTVMEDGYTEYEASVLPKDEEYIEYEEMAGDYAKIGDRTSFQFSVNPKVRKFGLTIQLKKGELVEVNAKSTPADKSIEIGLKKPDGKYQYVVGRNIINHAFKAKQDGKYTFFVRNISDTTVSVSGKIRKQ